MADGTGAGGGVFIVCLALKVCMGPLRPLNPQFPNCILLNPNWKTTACSLTLLPRPPSPPASPFPLPNGQQMTPRRPLGGRTHQAPFLKRPISQAHKRWKRCTLQSPSPGTPYISPLQCLTTKRLVLLPC